MLWVTAIGNSAGIDFSRQDLTSVELTLLHLQQYILKEIKLICK